MMHIYYAWAQEHVPNLCADRTQVGFRREFYEMIYLLNIMVYICLHDDSPSFVDFQSIVLRGLHSIRRFIGCKTSSIPDIILSPYVVQLSLSLIFIIIRSLRIGHGLVYRVRLLKSETLKLNLNSYFGEKYGRSFLIE